MSKKKIVIVGAGISGLTAGIYGLKAGYQVDIYEQHSVPGGECTGWDRAGYHIDNCIHWMIGTKPGSKLNEIWSTVDAVNDTIKIHNFDHMYRSELDGESITLWSDIDKTEGELIKLSPEDEDEIRLLMDQCRSVIDLKIPADKPGELMGIVDLVKMGMKMKSAQKLMKTYRGMDTRDLMEKFKHPLIKSMISDFCVKDSLAYSFPMTYGNFSGGDGGIPEGGSKAMALRMASKFKNLGGKLHLECPVEKIEIESEVAKGLTLSDGRFIAADYIICACDTHVTFNALLDKRYMSKLFKKMYTDKEDYPIFGMFQVAYSVDSDEDHFAGEWMLPFEHEKAEPWMNSRMTVKSFGYEPSFSPDGKQLVQVLLGLDIESYEFWKDLYEKREDYEKFKQYWAGELKKKIEARFPAYEGKLSIIDTWTPMTYERYCKAYKGYNQAFTITKRSAKNPYPSGYIKGLENVLLAGQWLSPPGGLPGAAIQGKYSIQRLLKLEKKNINI